MRVPKLAASCPPPSGPPLRGVPDRSRRTGRTLWSGSNPSREHAVTSHVALTTRRFTGIGGERGMTPGILPSALRAAATRRSRSLPANGSNPLFGFEPLSGACCHFSRRANHAPVYRNWRRERDSNPRWAFDPYSLSRGAPSTDSAISPVQSVRRNRYWVLTDCGALGYPAEQGRLGYPDGSGS
jgi:hypothetical protein